MSDDDLFDDLHRSEDQHKDAAGSEARVPLGGRMAQSARAVLGSRRNRMIAGATVTAVVLASGSGAVYAATQTDTGSYRTAEAEVADVSETLALSGQLASSSSVDAAFQVAGTVSEVQVALGDTVEAGQRLAVLDTTDLDDAVTSAEDAVANAEQTLEDDLAAQASGTSSSSSTSTASGSTSSTPSSGSSSSTSGAAAPSTSQTGSSGTGSSGTGSSGTGSSGTGTSGTGSSDAATADAVRAVSDAQQALLAQYETTAAAGEASTTALAQAQEVCAPFLAATLPAGAADDPAAQTDAETVAPDDGTVDGTVDDTVTGTEAESQGATDTSDAADETDALQQALEDARGQLTECQSAVSATQDAQTATSSANTALTDAATALNEKVAQLQQLLAASTAAEGEATTSQRSDGGSSATTSTDTDTDASAAAPSTSSASGGSSTAAPSSSGASTSGGSDGSGVGGSSSGTVTAEQILADQAAIDLAEAQLAIAQQNVTFASLTTPVSGTVVAVSLAAGDSVSAASDSAVITVQSDGGYIVESTVSLSKIAKVEVGQTAEVTLPAFDSDYTGEVSSIGVLNVSDTSTPSYTVTIAVDADDSPRIGATANVEVALSDATGVLTVPTSAITRSGSAATVTVLQDGTAQDVAVSLGAVGSERTEILDGLEEGDVVVLADLDQVITSEDETSTGLTGLGGSSDSSFPGDFSGGDFPSGGFSGGDAPAFPGG